MKFFIVFALGFVALFAVAFGADCEVKGHHFNKNEKYSPPGECIEMTCEGVGAYSAKGCAETHSLKPCKYIPMDLSQPYPKCCPRHEC